MKVYLVVLLSLISVLSFSQNETSVVSKAFIKTDTIVLRFGTSDSKTFREGLEKGYKIERFESSIKNTVNVKEIIIPPATEIIQAYKTSSNTRLQEIYEIINEYLSAENIDEKSNEFMYAILLLSSSVDADFMNGLGLIYKDTDFNKNKKYVYRITINNNQTITDKNSSIVEVNPKKISRSYNFKSLEYEARVKRKEVYLKWNAAELEPYYAGYWIEKSTDSINFKPINNTPYQFFKSQYEPDKTHADIIDTAVVEGGTYFYRIRGINHFAEKGGYSNTVKVYVKKSLKGEVRIDSIYANEFDRVIRGKYLSFEAKDDNQLSHFVVFRSDSMAFGYEHINAVNKKDGNQFEFSVKSPLKTGERYYYKVAAISVDSDTVYSFQAYFFTLDQEPPSAPKGLKGEIDEKGVVSLEWESNTENDIRGYRVFWANSLKEDFVESTTHFVEGTTYSDTVSLRNLTSEIYYQIRAVDLNYNNSEACEPVKLLKPDTIAPVSCVFVEYDVRLDGVYLKWNNSSSEDVEQNVLIRENSKSHVKDTICIWSDTTTYFIDSTAISGETYLFSIATSDERPNMSYTDPLIVNYETGIRRPVQNITAKVNRESKQITLTWVQDNSDVYSYKIYRSKNDGKYKLYKTLRNIEVNEFIDSDLYINNVYHYKIKVVYKSGVNSELSEVIDVVY